MIELRLHPDAKDDMRNHFRNNPRELGFLRMLFKFIEEEGELLDTLLTHRDDFVCHGRTINVQQWREQFHRRHRDLWRLKLFDSMNGRTLPYRIIYAYKYQQGSLPPEIWILGVLPRNWQPDSFDYDEENRLAQRIINAYDTLY